MAKYVVSSTLENPEWNNTAVIRGDLAAEVSRLRAAEGGDVLVNGSAQLVGTLLENDLVDELRLMVFPVVLGEGKRLFGDGARVPMRLVESRPAGEVLVVRYGPAGEPAA